MVGQMKKKVNLESLTKNKIFESYDEECLFVNKLIESGRLRPINNKKTNGKKPALCFDYWQIEEDVDYSIYEKELNYKICPKITIDFYKKNLDIYVKEREYVLALNDYLKNNIHLLNIMVSENERSFEIWRKEKFLTSGSGKTVLKHCGIDYEFLNTYKTREPFAYFAFNRNTPQSILIIENNDPFYSIRKKMLNGSNSVLGVNFGSLIYGGGRRVDSYLADFDVSAEEYMKTPNNNLLYWGDLDYEGIRIYDTLLKIFNGNAEIKPFVLAYKAMLKKSEYVKELPQTKDGQNRNIDDTFFMYFEKDDVRRMKSILERGLYIPQEILNISDF